MRNQFNHLISLVAIKVHYVPYLVLDQTDYMLKFLKNQIKLTLKYIHPDRQTILTSSTWPFDYNNTVFVLLDNPLFLRVGFLIWLL